MAPAAPVPFAPGVKYDRAIPSLRQVLGHDSGEKITTPDEIVQYLKALQAAAPDRTRLVEYARTWENRPLYVMIISSAERIAKLDEIKKGLQRLADPRGASASDLDGLIKSLPVVTWLLHAVHGNEISSSDAALAEAHHLLAAQGDPAVDTILRESIVLIDPLENPDGRSRFVFQNLLGQAAIPDGEPASAEHDEPWPGGRSNHYLFDMNRDWFSQSQPETRGRTKLFLEWYPQVVVDLHEMGGNSSYYFAPPADPLNPHITKAQASWFQTFGKANADRFDARGFSYFIREVYDSFYPGYGESWPIFHGAVGMTYEQASARGLMFRREDDSDLTYRDGVLHHFTAAITTAETAARNREKLLRDFVDYRRTAIAEGEQGPVKEYVLTPGADPSRAARLARLLATQGFDVRRADAAFKVGTKDVAAGAFIVPVAQPSSRLLRNLMEPHIPQPDAFVKEQDRRRKKRLDEQIYDVTAWSLPLAFDVEVLRADRPTGVKTLPVIAAELPWALTPTGGINVANLPAAKVGYLLPWGSGTATTIIEALRAGLRVRSADLPFTLGGTSVSGRHGDRARRGESGGHGRAARRDCGEARRGSGADRQRVRRAGHLARQRRRLVPEAAARAARVGYADAEPVGGMGAVRVGAAVRPAGDDGAHRIAGTRRSAEIRRARAAVGDVCRGDWRRRAAAVEGLDQRGRHARHAGGSVTLGGARERRLAGHDDGAARREAGDGCARWGGAAGVAVAVGAVVAAVAVRRVRRRRSRSRWRRRSNRSASGRRGSTARSCA